MKEGKVQGCKELIAYQKAYSLVLAIYQITRGFPKEEIYGLASQMRRSAVSIPSNIAEGHARGTKEYLQFLKIALGSAAELETQLSLSKDLGFCGEKDFDAASHLNIEVIKLLRTYLSKVAIR